MILLLASLALMILKLTHVIAWSWWIVAAPALVLVAIWAILAVVSLFVVTRLGSLLHK